MMILLRRILPFLLLYHVSPLSATKPETGNFERKLSSNIALEVEYMRLYEGMSMEEGKGGKGKGMGMSMGKGNNNSDKMNMDECAGKGKGKGGMMMCDKPSKKGSMMASNKGKGMSKTKTEFPSQSVVPSISPVPSATVLPSLLPVPVSTTIPTFPQNGDYIVMVLSPFFVFYQIEQTRIPSMQDFAELSAFTGTYLNANFISIFSGTETMFEMSTTNITGSEFRLGQPVRVDYNTTVIFGFQSTIVPSLDELNAILAGFFEGTNGEAYASAVSAGLDPSNIFSTTTTVSFQEAPAVSSNSASARSAAIAITTTLTAFTLLVAAVLYRRRDYEKIGKMSIVTDTELIEDESSDDDTTDTHSISLTTKYRFSGEALNYEPSDNWKISNEHVANCTAPDSREASSGDLLLSREFKQK